MAAGIVPGLPTELWMRILSSITEDVDRPHLWMVGRHVSSTFRDAIERIFREKHLPKTSIVYDLGSNQPDINFEFDRLSDDSSTAIFKSQHDWDLDDQSNFRWMIENEDEKATQNEMPAFESPRSMVQVRRLVNDTPIPGRAINCDAMEVRCDWRGLFTALYAEELLCSRLIKASTEKNLAFAENLKAQTDAGVMDSMTAMDKLMSRYGDVLDESRRQARRVRIWRQYEKAEPGRGWTAEDGDVEEERRLLKRLKERDWAASFEVYSDEEDYDDMEEEEEEEEEEEQEGVEGDEWEDEEGELDVGAGVESGDAHTDQ